MFFADVNFVLNDSGFPNSWNFCEFTVFINVFNPHKTSVLNHPASAQSSMSFIFNFDFSYPKCHVFESHCRYQRIQSRWLLGWIFWCVGNDAKSPAWAKDPCNNGAKLRLLLIYCSSNGCFFCCPQYNKLGLNRVGCDRVNEILRTGEAAQGFASSVFVWRNATWLDLWTQARRQKRAD